MLKKISLFDGYNYGEDKKGVFTTPQVGNELACPHCKHEEFHIIGIDVYSRDSEDSSGHIVNVDFQECSGKVTVAAFDSKDVSSRRESIMLRMWCENDHMFYVEIRNHKGAVLSCVGKTPKELGFIAAHESGMVRPGNKTAFNLGDKDQKLAIVK